MKKKVFICAFLAVACISVCLFFLRPSAGSFEEKVLKACSLDCSDIEEIDIMYVTNTDVSHYSDIKDPSRLSAFCTYFSRFSFVPKKAHVFSSHTISLSAPGKDTRFYLWLGNDGRLLEIQWYGPGGIDGSAVFESDGEMSVSELLSAMGL